ncbi:MAG TPA: glycoside hydrolase domain-containing protein [Agriterribacter sp.]|nr:glycoside hydrolase domain-containing protein [Agriterribacter sp.]
MKRILILLGIGAMQCINAQDMSYSIPGHLHYAEKTMPSPAVDEAWTKMKQPVMVSFANDNIRYDKTKAPETTIQSQWHTTGWKGEKVHTQILVWSKQSINHVTWAIGKLANAKGQIIPQANITAGFVRYVITDEFAGGCGYRKPGDFDSSLVADAIDITPAISVEPNTVQPLWLSIQIPLNAAAGIYNGNILVKTDKTYTLQYSVRVIDRTLPPPAQWTFDLDLWQHPAAIARVHNVPLWSDAHFSLMKPYYTLLASAGQKNITASIMDEPWGHQTYDDFPGLVKWTKKKDGSWTYDYSLFDKYVAFVMSCGINKRINCYTMVPWALSFRYFDEASGKDTTLKAEIGSPGYTAHWTNMLNDFTNHLKSKGWFEITSIAMDERPMKDMQVVIALLKSIDPGWKISLAGSYHPEIEKDIFDYCLASNLHFDDDILEERKAQGKPSTYYTCCTENYPNGFTFSPPAENVWLGWYAAAKGFTGYLRWAYNSWVDNPLQDSRFRAWPAGDTYQVYPGPRSSIRFEKLIEGIQDFEKIKLLQKEFTSKGDTQSLQKLNSVLQGFEIAKLKTTPAEYMVQQAKKILNTL